MLLGFSLPFVERSSDWGLEQRNAANGVIESGHLGFVQGIEKVYVGSLKEELWLSEWEISGITANGFRKWHILGFASLTWKRNAESGGDLVIEAVLNAIFALVIRSRWSNLRRHNWFIFKLFVGLFERNGLDFKVDVSECTFSHDTNKLDLF